MISYCLQVVEVLMNSRIRREITKKSVEARRRTSVALFKNTLLWSGVKQFYKPIENRAMVI